MTTINQLTAGAHGLRAYVNHECAVAFRLDARLDKNGDAAVEFCATWGDVMNKGQWHWGCVHGATADECLAKAFAEIDKIKADHGRAQRELEQQAAALGFVLVKQSTP